MKYSKILVKHYLKDTFPKISKKSSDDKKQSYLSQMGIIVDKKGYHLECNQFSRFFLSCTDVVALSNGELCIYNQVKGCYEIDEKGIFQKLIKYMLNKTEDIWTPFKERLAMESIKRDIITVVDNLNDTNYLNLQNGLFSLSDYTLYPHSKDVFSVTQIPIEYTTTQPTPVFDKFIDDITMGDEELKLVLQEVSGYILSNDISAEKAIFLIGGGANGKSTYARILEQLAGSENTSHTPLSAFGTNFGLASMVGCSLNLAAENNATRINSEIFKAVVSGDVIEINRKYKPALNISLSTKLVCLFNELPDCIDASYGYFRRLLIIPFNNTFKGDEIDVNLSEKLKVELSGILNWSLAGLKRLRANDYKFTDSKLCNQVLAEYKDSINPVACFFESLFVVNEDMQIRKSDIFKIYEDFCKENAYEVLQIQRFWRMLKQYFSNKDYDFRIKKVRGVEYIQGFALKDNEGGEQ